MKVLFRRIIWNAETGNLKFESISDNDSNDGDNDDDTTDSDSEIFSSLEAIVMGNEVSHMSHFSKPLNSNSPYRRKIWQCNNKYSGDDKCGTPHIYDDTVKNVFVEAFNMLVGDREQLLSETSDIITSVTDTSELDCKTDELSAELDAVSELIKKCVDENARIQQDQYDYNRRYNALSARYESIKDKIDIITAERTKREITRRNASRLLDTVAGGGLLTEFDETMWNTLVDRITVNTDGGMSVTFKDDRTIDTALK